MSTAEKPLMLYTGKTPNGFKVTVFLEELKAAYGGPDYEYAPFCAFIKVRTR